MQQVRRLREFGRPWVPVSGIDVLPEQAMAQWQFMTGRIAPRYDLRKIDFEEIMRTKIIHEKPDARLVEKVIVHE